jgi:anti-sigma B factor antagonist
MNDGITRAQTSRPAIEVEALTDEVRIVHLRGEHDLSTKIELAVALAAASERPHVLVDLSDCTFIDSTAIALLIAAHRQQNMRNQRFELILPKGAKTVERILTLTRVASIITVHETRGAALGNLQVENSEDEPAGS